MQIRNLKIIFLIFLIATTIISVLPTKVYADNGINEQFESLFNGLNEEDFSEIVKYMSDFLGKNYSFKELLIDVYQGNFTIKPVDVLNFFIIDATTFFKDNIEIIISIILIAVTLTLLNIFLDKNNDNSVKNITFSICYSIVITLIISLIANVLNYAKTELDFLKRNSDVILPIIVTLLTFTSKAQVGIITPFAEFLSVFLVDVTTEVLLPVIYLSTLVLAVSGISTVIKLDNLFKSCISVYKWILGIITLSFTFLIAIIGVGAVSFNGISYKILKYTAGTTVPLVGNFVVGGMDTLTASALLLKNSVGVITSLYIIFRCLKAVIAIAFTGLLFRLISSLFEPIVDDKFIKIANGTNEVIKCINALVIVSAIMQIILIGSMIYITGNMI